jgi:hypothetical protein
MKTLLTTLVLASIAAAPAMARTAPDRHLRMVAPWSTGAYGQSAEMAAVAPRGDDVFVNGKYAGRDPDPSIRLEIVRTFGTDR